MGFARSGRPGVSNVVRHERRFDFRLPAAARRRVPPCRPSEPHLLHFAPPDFCFHGTTTCAILRQWGVEIGKRDFQGVA
ncbi:MAG: DUF1993 family protein [Rhodospirillales bacterium]|nr:DUF1993 family protein [Rhodospirillales bacterium]